MSGHVAISKTVPSGKQGVSSAAAKIAGNTHQDARLTFAFASVLCDANLPDLTCEIWNMARG